MSPFGSHWFTTVRIGHRSVRAERNIRGGARRWSLDNGRDDDSLNGYPSLAGGLIQLLAIRFYQPFRSVLGGRRRPPAGGRQKVCEWEALSPFPSIKRTHITLQIDFYKSIFLP
jgi:hypothetical protein